jgi:hypothetical protein
MRTNKQKNILRKLHKQEKTIYLVNLLRIIKRQINFKNKLSLKYSVNKECKIQMFKNNSIMFLIK